MTEIIEGEIIEEPGLDLEVRHAGGLFRTEDPAEFLVKATETATMLADVIRKQKLVVKIGQSEHVKVEGWTMLGSLLGVFPVGIWTRKLDDGWEARVEARTLAGQIVGTADAQCLRSEKTWANRDDYALRSMAQTRATSKALRMPLGFVMTLAGFDATPFEEMPPASELPEEQKATRGRGGLTPAQKKAYAAFKQREEAGEMTQGDFKALLTQAGAEDLAHATPEQCEQVIEWVAVDVPFDQTGPAQDPQDGQETNGNTAGTGGAGEWAAEADVTDTEAIAEEVGEDALKKLQTGLALQREKYEGHVRADWLKKQAAALLAKASKVEA